MHSLRVVFINYVKKTYHRNTSAGTDQQAEIAATKVARLGLTEEQFVELACKLWEGYCADHDMPYPYWTMVTGSTTFNRLSELVGLCSGGYTTDDQSYDAEYELEMAFATDYLDWMMGKSNIKPMRAAAVKDSIWHRVAQSICLVYGVPYQSPNYNDIYQQLERRGLC